MTRMWLINPQHLCRNHLLGEHKELHQLVGTIRAGRLNVVKGHADRLQVDTSLIQPRHDDLVREMLRRGYNHNSPLPDYDDPELGIVDVWENQRELSERCRACRERMSEVTH